MERKLIIPIPELTEAHRTAIKNLCAHAGITPMFFESSKAAEQAAPDAEIIFGNAPELARITPKLKWLCTPSAGVNQYAAPGTFASPDAVLTNSSGAYGVTIAEHAVMLLLEILRRQREYTQFVTCKQWIRNLPIHSVYDARITMLGTGDIGRKTAERLRAFRPASVTGVNRSGRNPGDMCDSVIPQSELDAILPQTDILICSLPGTPETEHMLDARRLALLPDGAVIINVGRGSVIDQKALEKELRADRLQAGLDVFEKEPIPADDPLWECPNLLITPHSAGNMTLPHTVDRIVEMFLEDLQNYIDHKPLHYAVDLKIGY